MYARNQAAAANGHALDLPALLTSDTVEVSLVTVILLTLVLTGAARLSINRARRAGPLPARLPRRVFRDWGYLQFKEAGPEPGSDPVRIVIYPPGISRTQAKALHLLSRRPAAGSVAGLAAGTPVLLLPDHHLGPPIVPALTLGLLVYCACQLTLLRVTGHGIRARCHTILLPDNGSLRSALLTGDEQLEQETLTTLSGARADHVPGSRLLFHRRIHEEAIRRNHGVREPGPDESGQ